MVRTLNNNNNRDMHHSSSRITTTTTGITEIRPLPNNTITTIEEEVGTMGIGMTEDEKMYNERRGEEVFYLANLIFLYINIDLLVW
jgi:hypothetical protein